MIVQELIENPFGVPADRKRALLSEALTELVRHHREACLPYRRILDGFGTSTGPYELEQLPYLPVDLLKLMELKSVPDEEVFKVLVSSGTSGQPSRVVLDRAGAQLQSRALVSVSKQFLGATRRPMLVVDTRSTLRTQTARAAGILGFSLLGRDQFFLLDDALRPDWTALQTWLSGRGGQAPFIFGFTFLVWQKLLQAAERDGIELSLHGGVVLHGGGWKKLESERVSPQTFRDRLKERFGVSLVLDYYGMVEQIGTVFMECEAGRKHVPAFADVLVRDPVTLLPVPTGTRGLLQSVSLLPRSYPGHSLLTSDEATVLGEDDCACGRLGKTIEIHGRLARAEARGCSDTLPGAA